MNEKFKSILQKEITFEDLKAHKKLTALAAVFFICLSFAFNYAFSESNESVPAEQSQQTQITTKKQVKSTPNREIIKSSATTKNFSFDPFSADHLTSQQILSMKNNSAVESVEVEEVEEVESIPTTDKIPVESVPKIESNIVKLDKQPEIKKDPIKLKGILYDGRNSIAIVEFNGDQMLSVGESVGNRKILDIQPDFIVLDTGEKIFLEF